VLDQLGENRISHFATVSELDGTHATAPTGADQFNSAFEFAMLKQRKHAGIEQGIGHIQTYETSHFILLT
jgi:hypothetical protein